MSNNNQISRLENINNRLEKAKERKMKIEALLSQVESQNREKLDYAKKELLNDTNIIDEDVLPKLREELSKISKENERKIKEYEDNVKYMEDRLEEITKNLNI